MEKRVKLLKEILIFIIILGIYYIFVRVTNFYIPCLFRFFTGFKCPGCGISHLLIYASKFEFEKAYFENQLLFFLIPFLIVLLGIKIVFMPKWLEKNSFVFNFIMWVCCFMLIVFGVIRNIS